MTMEVLRGLRRDLVATRVIRTEEKSEWDTNPYSAVDKQVLIEWEEDIVEADISKRKCALEEIGRLYNEDFSLEILDILLGAKRNNCFGVGNFAIEILNNFDMNKAREIEKQFYAMREIEIPIYETQRHEDRVSNRTWGDRDSGGYASWGENSSDEVGDILVGYSRMEVPDVEKRVGAVKKIGGLFRETNSGFLQDILLRGYNENNVSRVRVESGKALGFWFPRRFVHEALRR